MAPPTPCGAWWGGTGSLLLGAADALVRDASAVERQAVARELERVAEALATKSAEEVCRFFGETLRNAWEPSSAEELRMLVARIARSSRGRTQRK